MPQQSNNRAAKIQQAAEFAQQAPEFAEISNNGAQLYDKETPNFEHIGVDMYSKPADAIHIPNKIQQLDFKPEQLDNEKSLLDFLQNFPTAPIGGLDTTDRLAQFIEQLTATQSKIKELETQKANNEKARNSLQTQIARFEKSISLTSDLPKIESYNAKVSGLNQNKKTFAAQYKEICAQLKSLQSNEMQLQRKIQSLNTPIEIGGNNG